MSLKDFQGRWKEVESKNDSEFYKQMELGWIKTFLMTKVFKRDFEIDVKSENVYEYRESKFGHRDEVTLGVENFRTTMMGKLKALANLEENILLIKIEVVESKNGIFGIKLQPGTVINVRMEVNASAGKMTHQMILNGVVMEKVLQRQ